jgi:hypothetical protein
MRVASKLLLQIEERLGRFDSEAKLSKTGLKEFDRLIAACVVWTRPTPDR